MKIFKIKHFNITLISKCNSFQKIEEEQEVKEEELSDNLENQLVIDEPEKVIDKSENEDDSTELVDEGKMEKCSALDKNSNVDKTSDAEDVSNIPPVLSRVELLQHFKKFQKMSDNKFITIGLVRICNFIFNSFNFVIFEFIGLKCQREDSKWTYSY